MSGIGVNIGPGSQQTLAPSSSTRPASSLPTLPQGKLGSMKHEDHLRSSSEISKFESVVCGGTAGLVSRFVISPLDVLKIRFQLASGTSPASTGATKPMFPGTAIWHTARDLVKNEGITVFWKGNVPAELLYVLYGSIQFTTYKALTKVLNQYPLHEQTKSALAGSGAGVFATCITYPLDLFRTRFAADRTRSRSSIMRTANIIYTTEGYRGFFRGLFPTILSIAPNMALFFSAYEEARSIMAATKIDAFLPAPEMVAGFMAGIISKGIVFPLDVIRKRLQVQSPSYITNFSTAAAASSSKTLKPRSTIPSRKIPASPSTAYSTNVIKCAHQILTREGIRGLYKGYAISLLKSGPSSAVTIWTFEVMLSLLRFVKNKE